MNYKENKIKLAKIEGTIPVNIQKVEKYYTECYETQKKCRKMCDELKVIEVLDYATCIVLFRTKSKLIVDAREIIAV